MAKQIEIKKNKQILQLTTVTAYTSKLHISADIAHYKTLGLLIKLTKNINFTYRPTTTGSQISRTSNYQKKVVV